MVDCSCGFIWAPIAGTVARLMSAWAVMYDWMEIIHLTSYYLVELVFGPMGGKKCSCRMLKVDCFIVVKGVHDIFPVTLVLIDSFTPSSINSTIVGLSANA